jgi:hypothetical protein
MKKKFLTLFSITLTILLLSAVGFVEGESGPTIAGAHIYPSDDIWNVPVDNLPVDAHSADYVRTIGASAPLHPDFGSGLWDGFPIGIPYNIVSSSQSKKPVSFDYADESDKGPYPIPDSPLTEGGSDHHILILDYNNDILYELYSAEKQPDGSWHAGSGAIFNLSDYTLRPAGWTSADAAGLPILPGLVRYDEVNSGQINHAIRFTAPQTRNTFIWPARHEASSLTGTSYPPMGQRFRLRASFNTTGYSPQDQVILNALKKYGMILADNGASWYISGSPDERWNNDALHALTKVMGSDFEAVDVSSLMTDPNSGKTSAGSGNQTQKNGSIAISSNPAGAAILLDGNNKGTTPATLADVPAGSHTILLKKTGYSDSSTNVTVNPGKTTNLSVTMTPATGSISVTSSPSGATVHLDGVNRGTTPAVMTGIPTGIHTVLLKKTGYSDSSKNVTVNLGKTTNLSVTMTPATGSISVTSSPLVAKILLDGVNKGTTPAVLTGIPTGIHTVLLKKTGYSDYPATITVILGKTTNLSAMLKPSIRNPKNR